MMKSLRLAMLAIVALLAGCAGPQRNVDYTAFRESKPASILVLPPLNTSVDVAASAAVLSQSHAAAGRVRLLRGAGCRHGRDLPPERPDHAG